MSTLDETSDKGLRNATKNAIYKPKTSLTGLECGLTLMDQPKVQFGPIFDLKIKIKTFKLHGTKFGVMICDKTLPLILL